MEKAQAAPAAAKPHSFYMDNRKKADLTGVKEVLSFDENQVNLLTDCGEITLTGENMHVTALMLEEGKMTVEDVCTIMNQNPSWADGIPLSSAGYIGERFYFKD